MLTLWVVLPLSMFLYMFAVFVLAGCIAVAGLAIGRLWYAVCLMEIREVLGALIGLVVWGGGAALVGHSSLALGVYVLNGVLLRLA